VSKLKDLFDTIDSDSASGEDELEVYADTLQQALELAAKEFKTDITMLDYQVLSKGTAGLFGFGRQPYKVIVKPLPEEKAMEAFSDLDSKLMKTDIDFDKISENENGTFKLRITKSGIWLSVYPPKGNGAQVKLTDVETKINMLRITNADKVKMQAEVKNQKGVPVKIGEWTPNPQFDGTMRIELGSDEMRVSAHFNPPRFFGRHMETDDVIQALKQTGVLSGIREEAIAKYLEDMNYSSPLLAAEGTPSRNGKDAYIEYKVRIEKEIKFDEDAENVDFKDLNLIENVVVGQLLAVKIPAEKGIQGRTVTNKLLPAKQGKDIQIKYGEGTILSDDGMELTAEKNGQVIMRGDKICVNDVMIIQGDVNVSVGHVTMLGSVIITGSVLDDFTVKASGDVEVRGSVEKAVIEAEGDIVIRQGVNGRDEARIVTTGGSIYAKLVKSAYLIAEKNIIIQEELLRSHADAGNMVFCNGKRAQIVGGIIRAGKEINAKQIGSDSYTQTQLFVGLNPKILQQLTDLSNNYTSAINEKEKIGKELKTLESKKRTGKLSPDFEEKYIQYKERFDKLMERESEVKLEIEELKEYLNMIEQNGKVCVEKQLFPGVEIYIKNKDLVARDPYTNVKITLENDVWRFSNYEYPEGYVPKNTGRRRR